MRLALLAVACVVLLAALVVLEVAAHRARKRELQAAYDAGRADTVRMAFADPRVWSDWQWQERAWDDHATHVRLSRAFSAAIRDRAASPFDRTR